MRSPHRCKEWVEFKQWCRARRLQALPAHSWTVATYALWLADNRRYRSLYKRIEVITHVHRRACQPSPINAPIVVRTLDRIEENRKPVSTALPPDFLAPRKQAQASGIAQPKGPRRLRHGPPLVTKRPTIGPLSD